MNNKPKIVELELNKEKRKLIRLVAVKSNKKILKSKEEIVLESNMIKLKIDKENLIEFLKNFLCVIDKNYNKNRMVTLEYNMGVFILAKVMEMNEAEKENFVFELFYNIYFIILQKQ